ncbi:MAG TPA: cytochrome c-type biogenesis protein [Burkholderiales bacterium]|nr:cytochrome c-type biogenesis protein [Burkholderiales bacterium]
MRARLAALVLAVALAGAAAAAEVGQSALDKRAALLEQELRCLVCQNQTIADSNASLAQDLRREIREQLAKGASDQDVKDYMVARYGDFVLYRPPLRARTVLLWAGPFLLLALGAFFAWRRVTRRRAAEAELPADERARAAKLLE